MIRKIRCPECGEIIEIDVEKYLQENMVQIKRGTAVIETPTNIPKRVFITCSKCNKEFVVTL